MKIRHKIPLSAIEPRSADVSAAYQAEVDASVARGEAAYRKAMLRFERAEARLTRARKQPGAKNRRRQLAELEALVELRRTELLAVHRLLQSSPQSSAHRGRKSWRPVPKRGEVF